jgi:hypothetical protein
MLQAPERWTDVAQGFVPIAVALAGVPFIWYQLREVNRSVQGETLSELYGHYHDVVSIFLERPHLRPYFYENKTLDDFADPELRSQVRTMCELIAGVLEHAVVQEQNVPKGSWKDCWESYVRERLKTSVVLREYLKENMDIYLKTLPDFSTEFSKKPEIVTLNGEDAVIVPVTP